MPHYSVTKWIEPYVLLETLKSQYDMKDYTFDGFTKKSVKDEFLKEIKKGNKFGLYMKNVNKYYVFSGDETLNLNKVFGFTNEDYEVSEEFDVPLDKVDSGKSEAAILLF